MSTLPTLVLPVLDTVESYAARFRRHENRRDRMPSFVGIIEAIAEDTTVTPEVTAARVRLVVEALHQVEALDYFHAVTTPEQAARGVGSSDTLFAPGEATTDPVTGVPVCEHGDDAAACQLRHDRNALAAR